MKIVRRLIGSRFTNMGTMARRKIRGATFFSASFATIPARSSASWPSAVKSNCVGATSSCRVHHDFDHHGSRRPDKTDPFHQLAVHAVFPAVLLSRPLLQLLEWLLPSLRCQPGETDCLGREQLRENL